MCVAQVVEQLWQIFTNVLAHTQEKRYDAYAARAAFDKRARSRRQVRCDELEVRAGNMDGGVLRLDAPHHRLDRLAPARIARTVRKEEDAASRFGHRYRLSTSQPNAASETTE